MPPVDGIRWRGWAVVLGALCMLGAPGSAHSAGPASPGPNASYLPTFNFDAFTKNKPFRLNTLATTPYGPAWADILLAPQNFVACKGAKIALCYYSGPDDPLRPGAASLPCDLTNSGIANCTCIAIPPDENPYYVDINAILNLDVYLDTVNTCGPDGRYCKPTGPHEAPVCHAISNRSLIPGADLFSTFSPVLDSPDEYPIIPASCAATPGVPYAGCMTAPCKTTIDPATGRAPADPVTGLELVQCACPTYAGPPPAPFPGAPYQVGNLGGNSCTLGGNNVWSAAYQVPITLPDCVPDAPAPYGCPLLPRNFLPPLPANVSCQEVCSEYKQSNQNGIQVGFTCDATLCTAASDPALVASACTGLGKHSVAEILKLETEVGYSCSASQVCGCQPNRKTNEEIGRLNAVQRSEGIVTQCAYNGTLCGTGP